MHTFRCVLLATVECAGPMVTISFFGCGFLWNTAYDEPWQQEWYWKVIVFVKGSSQNGQFPTIYRQLLQLLTLLFATKFAHWMRRFQLFESPAASPSMVCYSLGTAYSSNYCWMRRHGHDGNGNVQVQNCRISGKCFNTVKSISVCGGWIGTVLCPKITLTRSRCVADR